MDAAFGQVSQWVELLRGSTWTVRFYHEAHVRYFARPNPPGTPAFWPLECVTWADVPNFEMVPVRSAVDPLRTAWREEVPPSAVEAEAREELARSLHAVGDWYDGMHGTHAARKELVAFAAVYAHGGFYFDTNVKPPVALPDAGAAAARAFSASAGRVQGARAALLQRLALAQSVGWPVFPSKYFQDCSRQ